MIEKRMIKVGTASAEEGEKAQGFLKIGELSVHSEITVPVFVVNGKGEGPTLWVNGGVHGDEVNGFMAVRRLALGLDPGELKGALICTPLSNPMATQWRQKLSPYDYLDLDQQFPGDSAGLLSQRVAYHLFQEIKDKAHYLINLHTAGTAFTASPYTVYKAIPGVKPDVNLQIEKMAMAFGARTNCKVDISSATGELPGSAAGALDVTCALHGIPAFMAEVGSGGKFEEDNIVAAEIGIRNVMIYLKMLVGKIERPERQLVVTKRRFLYCNKGGFLTMEVGPGTFLNKGAVIGRIIDLFSEVETIQAESEAFIILARVNPIVHTGDRVALIGLEWVEVLLVSKYESV
jgi:predicted deacylase